MITEQEFFGKPHTPAQSEAARALLSAVNALIDESVSVGAYQRENDPDTGCGISGARGGDGDGGFRTPSSTTGAPDSSHKILPSDQPRGAAVDVADAGERLDTWLDGFEYGAGANSKLEQYELYREHPSKTKGWCHLTTRAPASGHRTFMP